MSAETVTVEWSREANLAFQRHSYVAKVGFPDGFVVIVDLPDGAARHPTSYWFDRVLANAAIAHSRLQSRGYIAAESPLWEHWTAPESAR